MNIVFLSTIKCLLIINLFISNRLVSSNPNDSYEIIECTDQQNLMIIKEGNRAFETVSYMPKNGTNISMLTEGMRIIWKAEFSGEFLSLLKIHSSYGTYRLGYVHSLANQIIRTSYFTRDGHDWYKVDEEYYNQYLKWLESIRIFDVSNFINNNWCYNEDNTIYGMKAVVSVPYHRFSIVEVCDGDKVIWQRNNEIDHATAIIVHGEEYNKKMINVHLNIGGAYEQKYYIKEESDWKEITKEEFYKILNDLDRQKEREKRRQRYNKNR